MPTDVVIVGSTGSVGSQALSVLEEDPGRFRIAGLAAATNDEVLARQIARCRPRIVAVADAACAERLRGRLNGSTLELRVGPTAAEELAGAEGVGIVVVAAGGSAGLGPALAGLSLGRTVALANKEAVVAAGDLLRRSARENGGRIVPLDSEHAAIQRILDASPGRSVRRVWLTASGGPFRDVPAFLFDELGPAHALRHPTWRMGRRTTVLSATLLNKALEVVEACRLFDLAPEAVEVVIHPESIVHALVEFQDGAVLAAMHWPDMKAAIRCALAEEGRPAPCGKPFDPALAGRLTFERPDPERFPALALGHRVARDRGTLGVVLAAAAVEAAGLFLEGRIRFPEITRLVEAALDRHLSIDEPTLEDVRRVERRVREEIRECPAS